MSAWYIFNCMGFYPVNPASGEYIIGTPSFDHMSVKIPQSKHTLQLYAKGAATHPYIQGVQVDGVEWTTPVLPHDQLIRTREIHYGMSDTPQTWGTNKL